MLKHLLPLATALALWAGTVQAADFFDTPDKNKPAPVTTPVPVATTPPPATPPPATPATPKPATPKPLTTAQSTPTTRGSAFGTKVPGVDTPTGSEESLLEPSGFDTTLLKSSAGGAEKETGTAFRDLAPTGGFMVGLEYTVGTTAGSAAVTSLRPLFLAAGGMKKIGDLHGTQTGSTNRLEAKPGYAVAEVQVRGTALVEGFQLTFMKIKGDALDGTDSYQSAWVGNSINAGKDLVGKGQAVVGFYGSADKFVHTLGIFVRKSEPKIVAATPRPPAATPRIAAATPKKATPVPAITPPPGLEGDVEVFACADDEYTLFLNGQPILSGKDMTKVQTAKFKIVKGDVLAAVVTDKGSTDGLGAAWFSLRVVRDGKTVLDAGDMTYLTNEPPSWKTSRMMTGFRPPKVWTQALTMGGDTHVRAAWAGPKDTSALTLYFKALVP
jgi:hypothetical protein